MCIIRLFMSWYSQQIMQAKWGNSFPFPFYCNQWVRQSGAPSPYLFAVYCSKNTLFCVYCIPIVGLIHIDWYETLASCLQQCLPNYMHQISGNVTICPHQVNHCVVTFDAWFQNYLYYFSQCCTSSSDPFI